MVLQMKLTTLLLTVLLVQVSARTLSQKVTYAGRNVSLETVFSAIEKQTGYVFFYNSRDMVKAGPVSVTLKDVTLQTALEQSLKNQPLRYVIKGNTIFINASAAQLAEEALETYPPPPLQDIRGIVRNSAGQPVEGAAVAIVALNKGTTTDKNGVFVLTGMPQGHYTIEVSYIGYKRTSATVHLDSKAAEISIILEEANNSLDDIAIAVNTGYQKIRKDQLTGAASTVTEAQFQQREALTGNFLESLEGKVPGLVYNPQSGELTIRGVSTFDAVKQPLIVVDGFPTEIDLRTINPMDIVSVSVLRDAAAASIYGVRASNGVIIVETRRGKSGKPVMNLRSSLAIQNKPDFSYLKYAPANEFVQLQADNFRIAKPNKLLYDLGYYKMNPAEEILFQGPRDGVTNPPLTLDQVNAKLATLGSYDNLKEYENLFYQNRQIRNVNLDASGGSDRSTYMLGVNYVGETPVNRGSENNQFMLNLANTIKFSNRVNFDFKGTYTNGVNKSGTTPPYSDFFPYEHLADANGNALPVSLAPYRSYSSKIITPDINNSLMAAGLYDQFYYPYRELTSNTNTTKISSVRFQGRINTKITSWLTADLGGSYENQQAVADRLYLEDSYKVRTLVSEMAKKDAVTGKALFTNMPKGNILVKTAQKITNYTLRGQLNFNKKLNGTVHDLSGIMGIEQKRTLNTGNTGSYFGYDPQTLISKPVNLQLLDATVTPAFTQVGSYTSFRSTDYFNQTETERRFMSYYGQGTYIFQAKYVATGSFRIDQSNLFGADPKYRNKPLWSAGVNWRAGEEDFVKKISWINQLQLRAATGFNGNVPNSNNGPYLILSSGLNTALNTPLSYNDVLTPENQSIRWETTRNYNLGLDYSMLKSRLSGSIDWYMKKSVDVFGQFDADPTSGFNQYMANTASIRNTGWELQLNSVNVVRKKFQWRTQLTASFNDSKVLDVKATEFANSQLIVSGTNNMKGYPLGALFSYNYGGLNSLGQPFVRDAKGNQKVLAFYGTSQVDVAQSDLIYNGTTTPKYVLGLNNQFSIGAFDLSFLWMYYGGHKMRVEQPNPNSIGSFANNPLEGSANYWRKAGDEANTRIPGYVRASSVAVGYYQSYALYAYQYASEFVRNADYIRLRDVIITYHAKARFIEKAGFSNLQLRCQAQNAFRYTFSGNDIDPDAINRISGVRMLETQPLYSLTLSTNF
jgi:TonB-linked SusC/RagA family outer membrane protein